jgi:hypothetical protein
MDEVEKIYPKVNTDDGLKFRFKYWGKFFTIRFAWNPIFLLEHIYTDMWGNNFAEVYKKAKEWGKIEHNDAVNLKAAQAMCEFILNCISNIRSPFVIYVKDDDKAVE